MKSKRKIDEIEASKVFNKNLKMQYNKQPFNLDRSVFTVKTSV